MSKVKKSTRRVSEFEYIISNYELEDFAKFFNKYDEVMSRDGKQDPQHALDEAFRFFHPEYDGRKSK